MMTIHAVMAGVVLASAVALADGAEPQTESGKPESEYVGTGEVKTEIHGNTAVMVCSDGQQLRSQDKVVHMTLKFMKSLDKVAHKTLKFTYGNGARIRCRELYPSGTPGEWGEWSALEGESARSYTFLNGNTAGGRWQDGVSYSADYRKTADYTAKVRVRQVDAKSSSSADYVLTFIDDTKKADGTKVITGKATCRIREMSRETEMENITFTLE